MKTISYYLPERFVPPVSEGIEEIRFRIGERETYHTDGNEKTFSHYLITQEDLERILACFCENSLYSANENIKEGFLMIPGGHRVGICGECVISNGKIVTLKNFSSLNIRIASDRKNIAPILKNSTLIIGPPGCGKTTLLRDCIRLVSDFLSNRVGVVDERGEIAACKNGVPGFYMGKKTDILSNCKKEQGILLLLRSMSPQWIALDEITDSSDVESVIRGSYCGVKFLATAHAKEKEDLFLRPIYRKLMDAKVFSDVLLMDQTHHFVQKKAEEL